MSSTIADIDGAAAHTEHTLPLGQLGNVMTVQADGDVLAVPCVPGCGQLHIAYQIIVAVADGKLVGIVPSQPGHAAFVAVLITRGVCVGRTACRLIQHIDHAISVLDHLIRVVAGIAAHRCDGGILSHGSVVISTNADGGGFIELIFDHTPAGSDCCIGLSSTHMVAGDIHDAADGYAILDAHVDTGAASVGFRCGVSGNGHILQTDLIAGLFHRDTAAT